MRFIIQIFCTLFLLNTPLAFSASDIVSAVRNGNEPSLEDSASFEIGLGLNYGYTPDIRFKDDDNDNQAYHKALVEVGGEYRHGRYFAEAVQGTVDGINLGYTLLANNNLVLDLLALSGDLVISYHPNEDSESNTTEAEKNDHLEGRDTTYSGTGFRLTHYLNNYILQYRLVTDTHSDNGISSTIRLGSSWLHKNWNIHAIVGAEYLSEKSNRYQYGITAAEATTVYQEYTPDSALNFSAEVGVSYPISENWVFRSRVVHKQLSKEVYESPLIDRKTSTQVKSSLSYVF